MEEIIEKIEWMIQHDFLEIQYSGKLPMIIFSPRGWTIQRDQYADELLLQWEEWLAGNITPVSMEYLKDRNRGLILLFLEKIRKTGDKRYIPFLRRWESIDYKKVVQVIRRVVDCLESGKNDNGAAIIPEENIQEQFEIEKEQSVMLKCYECGKRFLWDVEEQRFFKSKGFVPPRRCPSCREKKYSPL